MKSRILAAALAAATAATLSAAALGGTAHAAGGFTDTSVQGSSFVFQHFITGPASAHGTGVVAVTGLKAVPTPPNSGGVTYKIIAGADVDGVQLSVTDTDATSTTTGVISADHSLNPGAGTHVDSVVTLSATDNFGDVAIVTVPVTVADNSVSFDSAHASLLATDEVTQLGIGDNNPDGSITFTGVNTGDGVLHFSEGNLPAGLVSGDPKLLPGTAVPGFYKDATVTATDAQGAQATGGFLLKVNGGPTATAPVPVLSHGSAVSVSNNRENVYFDTTITTWVHFQIVGPGAINGHEGWVLATAGSLNKAVYGGLLAGHTYAVFYTPVTGQGSSTQIVGTKTGHVTFVTAHNK